MVSYARVALWKPETLFLDHGARETVKARGQTPFGVGWWFVCSEPHRR